MALLFALYPSRLAICGIVTCLVNLYPSTVDIGRLHSDLYRLATQVSKLRHRNHLSSTKPYGSGNCRASLISSCFVRSTGNHNMKGTYHMSNEYLLVLRNQGQSHVNCSQPQSKEHS